MIHAIARWLNRQSGWEQPITGGIVVGMDRADSANVVLLLFDAAGRAAAVAKVSRQRAGDGALANEYTTLRELWELGTESVCRFAPEPVALRRIGGSLVLVEKTVLGRSMLTRYYRPHHTASPDRVATDVGAVASWIDRFQAETRSGWVEIDRRFIQTEIDPLLHRFRRELGWTVVENEIFSAVKERALELTGLQVPLVAVHGDCWMGNFLLSGERVTGVIDWECSQLRGLPFADIYKLPTSYGFYLDRPYPGAQGRVPGHPGRALAEVRWRGYGDWANLPGFGYTYFGEGWFPELVHRFVSDRLSALGLPAAVNAVFFPLFLAQQAMTLDVEDFRSGYRTLLTALWRERQSTWLLDGGWSDEKTPHPLAVNQ